MIGAYLDVLSNIWEGISSSFSEFFLNVEDFVGSIPPFLQVLFFSYIAVSLCYLATRRG